MAYDQVYFPLSSQAIGNLGSVERTDVLRRDGVLMQTFSQYCLNSDLVAIIARRTRSNSISRRGRHAPAADGSISVNHNQGPYHLRYVGTE